MASIISAGTTSGTSLNLSADTSGVLQLATNGTTTAVTIDTSQNVGIGTASPAARLQVVGTDGTAGGTNTVLRLLGNIGGANKSGGLFFRTLNSTTVGTERIAIIQSTDVDNNNRVLALNSAGGNVLIGTTTDNTSGGVLQVSNGITFPATQSASSDANTLDDYEEGTWSPSYTNISGASTLDAQYTKIGRVVYIMLRFNWTGGSSSTFTVTLPFQSRAGASVGSAGSVFYQGASATSIGPLSPHVSGGSTAVAFYRTNNTTFSSVAGSEVNGSYELLTTFFYTV